MSAAEAFLDTSVVLYLLSAEGDKADRVETLLGRKPAISVQVLNEFAAVSLRKRALTLPEVREFLGDLRELCITHPLTVDDHERGLEVAERYGYSLYDSMIVATALHAGCRSLYSEDLQHGQVIDRQLKVINPFAVP